MYSNREILEIVREMRKQLANMSKVLEEIEGETENEIPSNFEGTSSKREIDFRKGE